MRIGFNPYITTPKYQKQQTPVTFQGSLPKKINSMKIFELEGALKPLWFDKEKYLAKLKEFEHIDINSRNFAGDTLITKSAKENGHFLRSLFWMERRGEIEGVDWNATDRNGDNIIMLALKNALPWGTDFKNLLDVIQILAEENKIDVNYINQKNKHSLMDYAIQTGYLILSCILELKGIDITKTCSSKPIIMKAIDKALVPNAFKQLTCHPSMDMSKYNIQELIQYINNAPTYNNHDRKALEKYEKDRYIESIKTGLQFKNVRNTQKYYKENGVLTLNQIEEHIRYAVCEDTVNLPLNDIGENIGHFLAETYIKPNDKKDIEKVKEIISELRKNSFSFWKTDDIGRTPLMIALESENLVVAKAIMERMTRGEFKYFNTGRRLVCAIRDSNIDHEFAIRELINKLQPKEQDEFRKLLDERLKAM